MSVKELQDRLASLVSQYPRILNETITVYCLDNESDIFDIDELNLEQLSGCRKALNIAISRVEI